MVKSLLGLLVVALVYISSNQLSSLVIRQFSKLNLNKYISPLGVSRQLTVESNGMTVYIRHDNKQIAVDVAHDATVENLIDAASGAGLLGGALLSFGGQALGDPCAQLSDLGIGAEAQLIALVSSPFGDNDDFEIDGSVATLKDDSCGSGVCFTKITTIGQISKMRVRILNGSARFWAEDASCTEKSMYWRFQDRGVHYYGDDIRDLLIEVNARERGNVTANYKDARCMSAGYDGLTRSISSDFRCVYNLTDQSQIQICVKLRKRSEFQAKIQFVDFELVE